SPQQHLGRPDGGGPGWRHGRRAHGVGGSGRGRRPPRSHGCGARLSGANRRSYGIGDQAPVWRQGYQPADTRPWWHNGSSGWSGDRGGSRRIGRLLPQRAFAGTSAADGVLEDARQGATAERGEADAGAGSRARGGARWPGAKRGRSPRPPPCGAGAAGSVGQSRLALMGRTRDRFEVVALTARHNAERLAELAVRHQAGLAVIAEEGQYHDLKQRLAGTGIEVAAGMSGLIEAALRT